jgi:hypothetical protein
MFTYNMLGCLTANSTGLVAKFWKLYTPLAYSALDAQAMFQVSVKLYNKMNLHNIRN